MMISCLFIYIFLFMLIQIISIKGLTILVVRKNRFIDYNQMVEARIEQEDDKDDEHGVVHSR